MIGWYVVLTPLLVLAILLLFRFVGCDHVFGLEGDASTLTWEGKIRDRVGQGKLALAPDGENDGTITVTLNLSGSWNVTALRLDSYPSGSSTPVGSWDTDINSTYFVVGASQTLDGPLLNDPGNAAVNFVVAEGGSFVIFASDLQGQEFLSGNKLSLATTFSDGSTTSTQVVLP